MLLAFLWTRRPGHANLCDVVFRLYKVTNSVNGKQYIGLTERTLAQRWERHCAVKNNMLMHKAIRKYGVSAFTIEELCQVATLAEAAILERKFIAEYGTLSPNGYNITPGGEGRSGPRDATTLARMGKKWRAWWESLPQSKKSAPGGGAARERTFSCASTQSTAIGQAPSANGVRSHRLSETSTPFGQGRWSASDCEDGCVREKSGGK